MADAGPLLEVKDLKTYFFTERGVVTAVDGVSLEVRRGRSLGVVGESGCGKSITSLSILRLLQKPGRIVGGQILYHWRRDDDASGTAADASGAADDASGAAADASGTAADASGAAADVIDITALRADSRRMREIRGGQIAMIFQEPMTSLDPVYTVGDQMVEGILHHIRMSPREALELATDMLARVNMPDPARVADSYPHQLSGGMRQRAMIAMALSCGPGLLIADEPTTALDVTTQAQILQLLQDLQDELGMAIMYITHDLGVVAEMVEEAIVMYLGKVVERGPVKALFYEPRHPYLQALLRSVPKLGQKSGGRLTAISGMVPSPFAVPRGCSFHPRCPDYMPGLCDAAEPPEADFGNGHSARCFLYSGQS